MNAPLRCLAALALILGAGAAPRAQESVSLQRQDGTPVSVTAYAPRAGACRGVAIISPGAGGSEQGYRYLGEALSSLGHLAVVVGHPESGRRALREQARDGGLREGLAGLITEPQAYRGRFMDITAARQWARTRCDAGESLLVGHSMGAATAMMEAGARNMVGVQGARSFGAYIALSPQGAGQIFPRGAWSDITQPVLLLTGTRDKELGGASWESRTEPFHDMPPGCKWLGIIDGASHMNFAGRGLSRKVEALTTEAITAFLEGLRRGDCRPPGPPGPSRGLEISTR
jgi:predicted dienelactone hydrolase